LDYQSGLEKRLIDRHRRQIRTIFQQTQSKFLNFSSFDFLNLTQHPYLKERGISSALLFASGNHPSRPLGEFLKELQRTEKKFASLLAYESATLLEPLEGLFSQILHSFITPKMQIIQHRHFPYPIHQGNQTKIFDTGNFTQLQSILSKINQEPILFLIESIDSKTGMTEDLDAIIEIAISKNAFLIVDDSNSIQVLGRYGMGLAHGKEGIDLLIGNFGKKFGSFASYFASTKALKDLLLKKNPFLYQQMILSPFLYGMVDASLDLIPCMDMERAHILSQAKKLRSLFTTQGIPPLSSNSHIMSIPFSSPTNMKAFNLCLTENKCQPSILSNSNASYSRFIVNSSHTSKDLHQLETILKSSKQVTSHESL
jgi:8-amino-7-oxononanoate synthase